MKECGAMEGTLFSVSPRGTLLAVHNATETLLREYSSEEPICRCSRCSVSFSPSNTYYCMQTLESVLQIRNAADHSTVAEAGLVAPVTTQWVNENEIMTVTETGTTTVTTYDRTLTLLSSAEVDIRRSDRTVPLIRVNGNFAVGDRLLTKNGVLAGVASLPVRCVPVGVSPLGKVSVYMSIDTGCLYSAMGARLGHIGCNALSAAGVLVLSPFLSQPVQRKLLETQIPKAIVDRGRLIINGVEIRCEVAARAATVHEKALWALVDALSTAQSLVPNARDLDEIFSSCLWASEEAAEMMDELYTRLDTTRTLALASATHSRAHLRDILLQALPHPIDRLIRDDRLTFRRVRPAFYHTVIEMLDGAGCPPHNPLSLVSACGSVTHAERAALQLHASIGLPERRVLDVPWFPSPRMALALRFPHMHSPRFLRRLLRSKHVLSADGTRAVIMSQRNGGLYEGERCRRIVTARSAAFNGDRLALGSLHECLQIDFQEFPLRSCFVAPYRAGFLVVAQCKGGAVGGELFFVDKEVTSIVRGVPLARPVVVGDVVHIATSSWTVQGRPVRHTTPTLARDRVWVGEDALMDRRGLINGVQTVYPTYLLESILVNSFHLRRDVLRDYVALALPGASIGSALSLPTASNGKPDGGALQLLTPLFSPSTKKWVELSLLQLYHQRLLTEDHALSPCGRFVAFFGEDAALYDALGRRLLALGRAAPVFHGGVVSLASPSEGGLVHTRALEEGLPLVAAGSRPRCSLCCHQGALAVSSGTVTVGDEVTGLEPGNLFSLGSYLFVLNDRCTVWKQGWTAMLRSRGLPVAPGVFLNGRRLSGALSATLSLSACVLRSMLLWSQRLEPRVQREYLGSVAPSVSWSSLGLRVPCDEGFVDILSPCVRALLSDVEGARFDEAFADAERNFEALLKG